VKGPATSGTKSIRSKAIVYANIKSVFISWPSKLNRKTYINHALKTSQYLCYRRPDERKVVENPSFPD